jgi:cytochrome P450
MTTETSFNPFMDRPEHVPASLVYDFDTGHDAALLTDPHKRISELVRHAPPIFWTPHNGGNWVFLSHAAIFDAARDCETFSSAFFTPEMLEQMTQSFGPDVGHIPLAVPIGLDPPEHTKYRLPLQATFSPKTINVLKESIRTLAAALVDEVAPAGRCEFMSAVAEPLPVKVFMKMLGLPLDRFVSYRALVKEYLASIADYDFAKTLLLGRSVADGMRDVLVDRRDRPKDDIISLLWKIEIDGKKSTMEDMENYGLLLFVAGLDTVMQGMGHGIRHLAAHPDVQRQLRAKPELIPEAVEELLRRYTFTVPVRRVARDTEFHGVTLKANERVMLYLPAADLDPKEFPEPERFNLARENKTHIAFNAGPHRCLGSHLARVELQILFEEILRRLPEFRLDSAHKVAFHAGNVIGIDSMYLIWSAK